ncbi:MAG: hypothetical protein IJV76_06845, partial [Clostridia bacterium]|nr:hypothetical protein [Clostridia bacterium]
PDLTAVPSDELNERTLTAMHAAEPRKTAKKIPLRKRIAVCAALFCAALVLMGAGVRIFEYLTFVPGMGIVTAKQEEVFTLEETVSAGGDRIEAASMIPAEDKEHEGMWEVTVLTNRDVPHDFFENPDCMPKMTLYGKDNEPYTLTCTGGNVIGARYTGYAVIDPSEEFSDYTLTWGGTDCTISMKSMENSVWANYAYPVSDGLTVIAFPLAEDSRYLVFDVILDPQSENMDYWATHSEVIHYHPKSVTVTDAEGNSYVIHGAHGRSVTIPESEMEYGVNALVAYKMEYILTMDEPLAAEIVSIEVDNITVEFDCIKDTGDYLVKIPELNETVPAENLPNAGILLDQYGIRFAVDEMTSVIDELNNTYEILFRRIGAIEYDFEENVVYAKAGLGYIEPERADTADSMDIRGGGGHTERENENDPWTFNYTMSFNGTGDRRNRGLDLTFGDNVWICLKRLFLEIDGNWHIDFTSD